MSLLSVTVKKAHYIGPQAAQFNTYVTLKLQNVKSTTVTVKGADPCWEQDFLFETNDITAGLLVEVWNKGMIWDRAIGYHWLPLQSVHISNEEGRGRWVPLAGELIVRGSEIVGTAGSTGHALLLDCRFELPFDAEGIEAAELQRKLDLLNHLAEQERADQTRRQLQYTANSGYSEDSDYTSDLNFPVGQHPNSSASQFKAAAHQLHTPTRSFETSRENSYERDEVMYGGGGGANIMRGAHDDGYGGDTRGGWDQDPEPLYYNSRPRYTQEYSRMDDWRSNQLLGQQSMESDTSYHSAIGPPLRRPKASPSRKPSLERQNTSYDETCDITPTYTTSLPQFSQQTSYEEYYDTSSYPYQSTDEYSLNEGRQWDSGGYYFGRDYSNNDRSSVNTMVEYENTINKRRSSVIQLPQIPTKTRPHSVISETYGGTPTRRLPRIGRGLGRITPEVKSRGASLPATPPGTPKIQRQLPRPPAPASLPPAPTTPRMLPRPPTAASQVYDELRDHNKSYNEDYNYGYDSLEDQSHTNIIDSTNTSDYVWPRKRLPVVTESSRKLPAPPALSRNSNLNSYQTEFEDKPLITSAQTYTTPSSYDNYNSNLNSSLQQAYDTTSDNYNNKITTDYDSTVDMNYTNSYTSNATSIQNTYTTDVITQPYTSLYATETTTSLYGHNQTYAMTTTANIATYNDTKLTTQNEIPYIVEDKSFLDNKTNSYGNQGFIDDQKSYLTDDQQAYSDDQYMNESFYSAESQPYGDEHDQYFNEDKTYLDNSQDGYSYPTTTAATMSYKTDYYGQQSSSLIGNENLENDLSYKPTEPYFNESEPYYDGQTPYNKDLTSYQQDSYQHDTNQYQTPVTTSSYQTASYISDSNQIPYSSSQWMPADSIHQAQTSIGMTKTATDVPKSLPSSQSSTFQAGLAGAPIAAAAAAQTLGKFMASGAMKLGSFLSSAASKQPAAQPITTTATSMTSGFGAQISTAISTSPYSVTTTAATTIAGNARPQLRQQVSVTEPEPYHPYSQLPQDSVPSNYQTDQYVSSDQGYHDYQDDYYKNSEIHGAEQLDYTIHGSENLHDTGYKSGIINQHDKLDHHYEHEGMLDEYGMDEQGFVSDHSKTQNGGSPVSVIHVAERLEPITGSFEEDDHKIENSLVEPYRPKAISPSATGSRKTSVEVPYRSSPSHDVSQLIPTGKDLLPAEKIGSPPPDTRLPQALHAEIVTGSIIGSEEKGKSVSFEEEETARRPAGARQRWHWAYAKILMQLNVSDFTNLIINRLFLALG